MQRLRPMFRWVRSCVPRHSPTFKLPTSLTPWTTQSESRGSSTVQPIRISTSMAHFARSSTTTSSGCQAAADVQQVVGPSASREDHINSPSAGLDGQWALGRQIFSVQAQVADNRYAENTNLNNVSTIDKAIWNWGVASVLSGQVGAEFTRSLLSFVNAAVYERNTYNKPNTLPRRAIKWGRAGRCTGDSSTPTSPLRMPPRITTISAAKPSIWAPNWKPALKIHSGWTIGTRTLVTRTRS